MKAVILAAGFGSRLLPYTVDMPKCLVEVNQIPILINMLEALNMQNIEEAIIVVGYKSDQILKLIGKKYKNLNVSYVYNEIFANTNTSYSLLIAIENLKLNDSLVILEGDVFFEHNLFTGLLKSSEENVTVVEKYNPSLDGSFVTINDQSVVTDWIHKTRRTDIFDINESYKTVNIHKFDHNFIQDTLLQYLKNWVKNTNGNVPIEYVLQDIVLNSKEKILSLPTNGLKWFEIDTSEDLKLAQQIFA